MARGKTKARRTRKDDSIRIRVTTDQKQVLTMAAQRAGLDVSSWLRSLGLREAEDGNNKDRGA